MHAVPHSDTPHPFGRTRVYHCGCGRYHLSIGPLTLDLSESELILLGRTVHEMASRRPELAARLATSLYQDHYLRQARAQQD